MEHLELSLVVNNHILCGIREARLMTPFDIRRLWEHFSKVVENLLENGFYENERLEDGIIISTLLPTFHINMIDVRKTLENLHQILPELSLEDLFRVLDAIEEVPQINVPYISTREY